jgi:xanthine dehydrogenase accessory factor
VRRSRAYSGVLVAHAEIGDHLEEGDRVAEVAGKPVLAPFKGVLRGIVHAGLEVKRGLKIGDVDPRDDPALCALISDRSLAVAGGVLEAVLRVR